MNTALPPDYGTLFGIGIGPGSADLITLRAITTLHSVDVILAAASPKKDESTALGIALPHLPQHVETMRLDFPMTRDKTILEKAWHENAEKVASLLGQGKNAAFLTLGDPLIYSTFSYLMRTLKKLHPEAPISVVPGITSFQAAAAHTQTVLCEGEENFMLIAGINDEPTLTKALAFADSAAILKAYRNIGCIRHALAATNRGNDAAFVSRLGLEGETICYGMKDVPETPHYLSLLLVPVKK